VGTVYPPLAQALFALAVHLGGGDAPFKLVACGGELLVLGGACALAGPAGAVRALVAWAWHPLVLFAFAGSGHVDSVPIGLTLIALTVALSGRGLVAGILLGLAGAAMLAPLALALAWAGPVGPLVIVAPVVTLGSYLPFAAAGDGLAHGLAAYATRWEHMGLVFAPLSRATSPVAARVACALMLVLLVASVARSRSGLVGRTRTLVRGALLLTPVLHPWYVCWAVPLCEPISGRAWRVLTLSAVGGYGPLMGIEALGTWGRERWWWLLTWAPVLLALIGEIRSRGRVR
jgi:hypothetical protein